jgi:hypothetical protein
MFSGPPTTLTGWQDEEQVPSVETGGGVKMSQVQSMSIYRCRPIALLDREPTGSRCGRGGDGIRVGKRRVRTTPL